MSSAVKLKKLKLKIWRPNSVTFSPCLVGGELAQVAGCPWTMRDSSGSLAQNRWQGELALGVGQEGNGAAGMPAGHLMDASSPNHVSSPMHLKLGQKERVNETEYMEQETIDDWRDEEEEEEEDEEDEDEEDEEDEDDDLEEQEEELDFEAAQWEGLEGVEEWQAPHEAPLVPLTDQQLRQQQSTTPPPSEEPVQFLAGDSPEQPLWSRLSAHKLRRLRRWRKLRVRSSLRFRLAQHWKTWRQRAQRMGMQGHRRVRRWRQHSLQGIRQRRDPGLNNSQSEVQRKDEADAGEASVQDVPVPGDRFAERLCSQYSELFRAELLLLFCMSIRNGCVRKCV